MTLEERNRLIAWNDAHRWFEDAAKIYLIYAKTGVEQQANFSSVCYGESLATSLGFLPSCAHSAVDTGMRWSYCRHCNTDMVFNNGAWVEK